MSSDNIKKIVVTGAGGFLGSNLVEALKEKSEYFVYSLSSRGKELQELNPSKNILYCHKNAVFSDEGEQILRNAIVVNCAFPRNSTGTEMADGLRYIQRLFDRSKECGVKAIINVSSQSVYSQTREKPATEETPVCLETPYAVGKYATELMLESMFRGTGIVYTNLRMASLIGPGFDQRIVNRLVKQAFLGEKLSMIKSNQRFGFLDIEDAVRAIFSLFTIDLSQWKPVYTVGNAEGCSIEDIVQCIKRVFDKTGLPISDICVKSGDGTSHTGVAYHLLFEDTGFQPMIGLDNSVQRILNHVQTNNK